MIATLWTALTSRISGYLAAIGVAAGILLAAYSKGRTDAGHAQTAGRIKASNKARKIENEVDSLGDGAVSDRLNEWMRDRG